MIYASFLNENNKIGVPAPSDGANSKQDINRFKNAKKQMKSSK